MELVRGEPLSSLIARGPLDPEQTLRIMEQSARALQAAHERGYVHRDVKPGNILIRVDGKVKLTDFGIAKAADAVPVTRSGMVMGTAHYIAPEQASGAEAGPAGDVYSLGIVGYECLAGHRPFRAESAVAVAMMQVREPPPPLPETVPEHVRALIDAVLVKDPARRYGTGGELAVAVAAVRRGGPLPIPGIPVQGGFVGPPMAIDETGETVYPPQASARRARPASDPGAGAEHVADLLARDVPGPPGRRRLRDGRTTPDAPLRLGSGRLRPHRRRASPARTAPAHTGSHRSDVRRPLDPSRPTRPHRAAAHPARPRAGPRTAPGAVRAAHAGRGRPRGAPAAGWPRRPDRRHGGSRGGVGGGGRPVRR